mgnify:CR=1 FL=1
MFEFKNEKHVIANPAVCHDYIYNSSSKVILSAGQLLKIKGYERVIEVARKILFKYPDWKWVICGEGPERQKLEKLILDAKLTNQVLLLGTVDDMDSQYKKAATYVLTSDMEGLPMVLLEAKSWGLPLVSFDIMTGPSDVIIDEVNGYLIKPYDIDAMAEKIEILISDKDKRVQFSANAQMDMQKFEEKYIISQWETIIGVE